MLWVFDELFEAAGKSFRAEVELERASILGRHVWSDGVCLDLHAQRAESAEAIGQVFGAREARAYLAFCEDGRRIYDIAESHFLRAPRPTVGSIVKRYGVAGLAAFARLDGHRSMWTALGQRFSAPRLRQLFARYATYCGSSPFEAPATLNLIAHVEAEGVFRARGGMQALISAFEGLARSLGIEIRHGHEVERVLIEGGRAKAAIVRGTAYPADAIVFNGDVSAMGDGLFGRDKSRKGSTTPREARSLSAVTWAMVARTGGVPLVHHNVFFSDDYAAEFESILHAGQVPDEPTVYICAQDRADGDADASPERLFVLVNAPATGDDKTRWSEPERQRCTTATLEVLRRAGLMLEISAVLQTTPAAFHRLFPATGGALYGPRSTGLSSALTRQSSTSGTPGLYLAGGSVHPGPGLPMATLSGRLAAQKVYEDLASTVRSRRAATSGTTSMG
jgi:1-hydroxycarotenoid 3,4-desaturase